MRIIAKVAARLPLLAFMVSSAAPAAADVDRTPKPGGVYKLKPGTFVTKGVSCASASNSDTKMYDGKGISTAHTRSCVARILSKRRSGYGYRYQVIQSCIDSGDGPGKRFTERQTVDVPDALNFSILSQGKTTYSYCPISR